MGRSTFLSIRAVELLVVAVLGAALALGGAAAIGKLGSSTTIKQVAAPTTNAALQAAPTNGRALTPEQVYSRDAPGVVQITATTVTTPPADPFNLLPSGPQTDQSLGSGFVIDKAGHIITNYHVIQGAGKVQVSFSGQDEITATVVGKDPSTDVAVLKIDAHARALTPLELGNSDAVVVGDPVYAIGNPFGFTRTLTTGVVSAVQRQIEAPNSLPIDHAIQTDAAINHGNSGGPLIDALGRVIGVTSQISTGSTGQQGNVGIGFAIPINTVRSVAGQIISTGKALHAFLGLSAAPVTPQLAKLFQLPTSAGLLVQDVQAGSGASKAGLKAGKTAVVVQGESYQIGGDII
ncbi:MAG TPA: trypsin-like peptidase domain-containing protein, partial [Gaiellaceae bacterium]|nr:trypsin-like peptidase domain-containing protein [Gaiellaceae bacterium]